MRWQVGDSRFNPASFLKDTCRLVNGVGGYFFVVGTFFAVGVGGAFSSVAFISVESASFVAVASFVAIDVFFEAVAAAFVVFGIEVSFLGVFVSSSVCVFVASSSAGEN